MEIPVIILPPVPRQYGECEDCHRVTAITKVLGYLPNGDPYGYCEKHRKQRETPAR